MHKFAVKYKVLSFQRRIVAAMAVPSAGRSEFVRILQHYTTHQVIGSIGSYAFLRLIELVCSHSLPYIHTHTWTRARPIRIAHITRSAPVKTYTHSTHRFVFNPMHTYSVHTHTHKRHRFFDSHLLCARFTESKRDNHLTDRMRWVAFLVYADI